MKKTTKSPEKTTTPGERIKLQISRNTIVIVRTKEALKLWMNRHPLAKIVT